MPAHSSRPLFWSCLIAMAAACGEPERPGRTDPFDTTDAGSTCIPAEEMCNGVDDDCDGEIDEGFEASTWYPDADGDGYGTSQNAIEACEAPEGYAARAGDCDDTNPAVHPGAVEACNGIDDDCNDKVDDGLNLTTWYPDADGDGYGVSEGQVEACEAPDGHAARAGDCDDTNPAIHPGAVEACNGVDDDCSGKIDDQLDLTTWYPDEDGDGHGDAGAAVEACEQPPGHVAAAGDCNDANHDVYPGAPELCDGLDNDCDDTIDEDIETVSFYVDADGDGWGDVKAGVVVDCKPPQGSYVTRGGDCDDTDPKVNPGATEICDGVDNDCAGGIDDGLEPVRIPDTLGACSDNHLVCGGVAGWVPADDNHVPSEDICNGVDDDCDGEVDEDVEFHDWFRDRDRDGFGSGDPVNACAQPEEEGVRLVRQDGDCDDTNRERYPGAPEACDGIDNDCDDEVDEGVSDLEWYPDVDGDGFGDRSASPVLSCSRPGGDYVPRAGDCDDDDESVNPDASESCNGIDDDCNGEVDDAIAPRPIEGALGACAGNMLVCDGNGDWVASADNHVPVEETCNGVDDDCNGAVDEGVVPVWYADKDQDNHGNASDLKEACEQPVGYVSTASDCDDDNAARYPGATEVCDGLDNDCNDVVDDDLMVAWYEDADLDSYGNAESVKYACAQPFGYVDDDTDCNDGDIAIHPNATEVCNGVDDDCNDEIDDDAVGSRHWYPDSDGDGYRSSEGSIYACTAPDGWLTTGAVDCNDEDSLVYPGAEERCNGVDDNCNQQIDENVMLPFFLDDDGDGHGGELVYACSQPQGTVTKGSDCDDADPHVYPAAPARCDGKDTDCNGSAPDVRGRRLYYLDEDDDGYGHVDQAVQDCAPPEGYVEAGGDCNDSDPNINPGEEEVCNGIDDDCKGGIDNGLELIWYLDEDQDGYGTADETVKQCGYPAGYAEVAGDCDDNDPDAWPGAPDLPDLPEAKDTNCDGIDGDIARAVFVDSSLGSIAPDGNTLFTSIQEAIDAVAADPDKDHVYIRNVGILEYKESIVVPDGVSLFGGYTHLNWDHRPTKTTSVGDDTIVEVMDPVKLKGGETAVTVSNYTGTGHIQGFSISAARERTTNPGPSAQAILLQNVTGSLHIEFNRIQAGPGEDGQPGSDGDDGGDGTPGEDGGTGGNSNAGGGGVGCGASGGAGGDGGNSSGDAANGTGGGPYVRGVPLGGVRGLGGAPEIIGAGACRADDGKAGGAGDNGLDGAGGTSGLLLGSLTGTSWRGSAGGAGAVGTDGKGGGGGGGGGQCRTANFSYSVNGGGAGGGGGGGCRGTGGAGGTGGGGSFGILAIDSPGAVIGNNRIVTAAGGDGGAGGAGGEGGLFGAGGSGALGGSSSRNGYPLRAGRGGAGGRGGYGGDGGGGAGGGGGHSVGVFAVRSSALELEPTNVFFLGAAGQGGAGGAATLPGENGADGISAERLDD